MENQSQPIYIPLNRFGSPGIGPGLNRTGPSLNPSPICSPMQLFWAQFDSFHFILFCTPPWLPFTPAAVFHSFLFSFFSSALHFFILMQFTRLGLSFDFYYCSSHTYFLFSSFYFVTRNLECLSRLDVNYLFLRHLFYHADLRMYI